MALRGYVLRCVVPDLVFFVFVFDVTDLGGKAWSPICFFFFSLFRSVRQPYLFRFLGQCMHMPQMLGYATI
jgi:hypothetical protein